MARGAGAERGRRGGASRESGAHGADERADAAVESDHRVAGDVGLRRVGACATGGRVVDHGAGLARRAPAPGGPSPVRPGGRAAAAGGHPDAALEQQEATVQAADRDTALGRLVQLKGVATTSASVLLDEGLVWRAFRNRREIGGLLGFAPAKYDSGDSEHDQGISRAGNAHLQAISIQLAWNWVRWQPTSALTRWYREHFGPRRRARRMGLWRWPANCLLRCGATSRRASSPRGRSSAAGRPRRRRGGITRGHTRAARTTWPGRRTRPSQRSTAAPVSGSRPYRLWGLRLTARARIEGEDWVFEPIPHYRTRVGQTS